ncbi:uncharacterized protein LOC132949907 [Metopolophium dirhodum]|uniref:uncharacterized protein LOC132949907 n=1 Tax=Metopolophium dirhodum TaxID=44670 RepID=UPI00298F972F|nr:uncharacterized protein LOC132949907 [Metopolophium dirhodum]
MNYICINKIVCINLFTNRWEGNGSGTRHNPEWDATLEEFVAIIKRIQIELISKHVPKNKYSIINKIKLLATDQLASSWMVKLNKSLKGVEENYGPAMQTVKEDGER